MTTWAFWANSQEVIGGTQQNAIMIGNRYNGAGTDYAPRQFVKFTPTKFEWHAEANGNEGKRVDVHAFARFPDGSTMIAESGIGRFIHVDRKGMTQKVVSMGEGGRKSTHLVRMLNNGHYLACAENPGVVNIRTR